MGPRGNLRRGLVLGYHSRRRRDRDARYRRCRGRVVPQYHRPLALPSWVPGSAVHSPLKCVAEGREQLVENTSTSALSGTRYYSVGGATVHSRASTPTLSARNGSPSRWPSRCPRRRGTGGTARPPRCTTAAGRTGVPPERETVGACPRSPLWSPLSPCLSRTVAADGYTAPHSWNGSAACRGDHRGAAVAASPVLTSAGPPACRCPPGRSPPTGAQDESRAPPLPRLRAGCRADDQRPSIAGDRRRRTHLGPDLSPVLPDARHRTRRDHSPTPLTLVVKEVMALLR